MGRPSLHECGKKEVQETKLQCLPTIDQAGLGFRGLENEWVQPKSLHHHGEAGDQTEQEVLRQIGKW